MMDMMLLIFQSLGDTPTVILDCLKLQKTKYDYVFLFLVEPFAEIKEDSLE